MYLSILFALIVVIVGCLGAVPGDLITSLPGFTGNLPSLQYSGYISVDDKNGRYLHYWLVLSENSPSSDPLVMWMNGGPGCSSLDGYLYEQGPLHFTDSNSDSDAIPDLELNEYRWNKIANMLFVEAPAGVGFSYSKTASDYNTNDNKTALDNFNFLVNFFAVYPEFTANPFYVTGESYAGVYVPTLVEQIMIHNNAKESNINLQGFMVGNGCTGNGVGVCSDAGVKIRLDFSFTHGLFAQDLYSQIQSTCDFSNPSAQCYALLLEAGNQIGDVNIYDIYTDCIMGDRSGESRRRVPPIRNEMLAKALGRLGGPDECLDGIKASKYLNDATVRTAIHVLNESAIGQWTLCTGKINYDGNIDSLLSLYPTLIKNYRALIYNGDVDGCVPYTDNEVWTSSLGIPVKEAWRPWLYNEQVAGYVTVYDLNSFTFITVKGAGHMVPEFKPIQAFEMFQRYLTSQPF